MVPFGKRGPRLQAAMQILADRSAPMHGREVWAEVCSRVPVEPGEQGLNASGKPKGETHFRWWTLTLVKAGWLRKDKGLWSVTDAGRAALREHTDPVEFGRAAEMAYQAWSRGRAAADDAPADTLLVRPEEPPILDAAALLIEQGLRAGGSAFSPGQAAWSAESAEELYAAFVGNPDLTPGVGFMPKLKGQLSGCSDVAILLAAELLTLNLLPLANLSPGTKRARINEVLGWLERRVEVPPLIDAAFDHGRFGGGRGFQVQIWKMLDLLIQFARHWRALPEQEREAALEDPWEWKHLVATAPGPNMPSQREALLYLAHPAVFLPIVSVDHKRAIQNAFAAEVSAPTGDVDKDLLQITLALQADLHEPVDYYRPPLLEQWKPNDEKVTRRGWLVRGANVQGHNLVGPWLEEGWVSLAAASLRPVEPGIDKVTLKEIVAEDYADRPAAARADKVRQFHAFLTRIRPGDVVVTTRGDDVYLGEVTGEPEFTELPHSRLRRAVDWRSGDVPLTLADLTDPLPAKLSSQNDLLDLTEELSQLEELLAGKPHPASGTLELIAADQRLAEALLTDQAWLQEAIELLWERRQLIFYGPPGTGKTYLATKLARHVTAPNNVKLIQFHPSYSYEDFFQGYRPVAGGDGKLGFELRSGPFLRLVEAASNDLSTPYILIIDEINRANLAKVFGELYFLLEYRDESISLLYTENEMQPFSLPKNIFIIGTMNTADRSIALVDAAMRRRFAFVPLHPAEEPVKGLLGRWLQRHDLPDEAARLLTALNTRVRDTDFAIGPSYFMRPEIHTSDKGLDRVWRTSIMPLLEELHYGEGLDVHAQYGLTALRASLSAGAPHSAPPRTVDFAATPGGAPNGAPAQT